MNNIVAFKFEQHPVRTVLDDIGEPWWVVKDICEVLGHSKPSMAIEGLDEDEVRKAYLTDSLGRPQEMLIVSESGTYALIIRSNKPDAKPFRKWITAEVLPAIRKTGRYAPQQDAEVAIADDSMVIAKDEMIDLLRAKIAYQQTLIPQKRAASRPLTEDEVTKIVHLKSLGLSHSEISRQVKRSTASISFVTRGAKAAEEEL